jgi:hypothetical protein
MAPRHQCAAPADERFLYRLSGVVVHSGGMSGGHYTAHVRAGYPTEAAAVGAHALLPEAGATWYHVSDSHVGAGSLSAALQAQAYILFYERVHAAEEALPAASRAGARDGGGPAADATPMVTAVVPVAADAAAIDGSVTVVNVAVALAPVSNGHGS